MPALRPILSAICCALHVWICLSINPDYSASRPTSTASCCSSNSTHTHTGTDLSSVRIALCKPTASVVLERVRHPYRWICGFMFLGAMGVNPDHSGGADINPDELPSLRLEFQHEKQAD